MKYILMCNGENHFDTPKQLWKVWDETIVERTIRLLRENGIEDIYISADDPRFENLGAKVIKPGETEHKRWIDGAFPILDEPVCYICGDVFFTPDAIKKIIEIQTDDIEFVGTGEPYHEDYYKKWAEPLAFKVVNFKHFREAIDETRDMFDKKILKRCISWELWQVIKKTQPNEIIQNYTVIHDWSCDVDYPYELEDLKYRVRMHK